MEADLIADLKAKKYNMLEDLSHQSQLRYLQNIVTEARIRNSPPLHKVRPKDIVVDNIRSEEQNRINSKNLGPPQRTEDIVTTKKLL